MFAGLIRAMRTETGAVASQGVNSGDSAPADSMSGPYAACAIEIRRLYKALQTLEADGALLQLAPLAGREWYELLTRKLLPQLGDEPFIVVAVVGGTNIGKSVIFNHLARSRTSSTSPLASGTKHPVCLVPPGFEKRHDLQSIFRGFELHAWTASDLALENRPEHRLFWQTSQQVPGNLLVLDTPDIDSDAEVNWIRADYIRHAADVLIAVLTQQKYNDAAVKQFFRKAAAEDKAVIVVFNQCLLPEDEQYWPLWLSTFTRETGIQPELVYVSPNDRRAAEENRLPFYLREWTPPAEGAGTAQAPQASSASSNDSTPHDLAEDLSRLHFDEIKIRTLRGSLRQIQSPQSGVPAYLEEIRQRSADFEAAAALLNSQQLARIRNWPPLPNQLMVAEVREWWRTQREGWTRTVHDVYNTIGTAVISPFRWMKQHFAGPEPDLLEQYRKQEREVILAAIQELYQGLNDLSQLGNELLRPRLTKMLAGERRAELLASISRAHDELSLEDDLREVVRAQMQAFREESPQLYEFLRTLDRVAAGARPMTSVVLFVAGGIPVADAVAAPLITEAVLHIAGGTGAVVAGEAAMSRTSAGIRTLEAKFRQLQTAFTVRRLSWLAGQLKEHLLGSLQEELTTSASLPQSPAFKQVEACLRSLEEQMAKVGV